MRTIKEVLHEKRKATEDHIKGLQRQGKQGVRYTAMMSDIPFLVLGLMSDIGWIVHLIAGARYFRRNGFHHVLDYMALISLTAVLFGVAQECENQGCGCVFRGFRRGKGAFSMGQPFASIQQGLYAGVQRFERTFHQRLFPVSRQDWG